MIKQILYKSRLIYGLLKSIHEQYWKLLMLLVRMAPSRHYERTNTNYAIGIITYVERFEEYFKPLVIALTKLFPDTQIIIGINGFHDVEKQRVYLKKASSFLGQYKNVDVIHFETAQSLSKLWNLVINKSRSAKVLVLNDDLRISPFFRSELEKSGILETDVALINRSWSHFLISKRIIQKIGWFDERFPAMGNEDEDYECRMALCGISREVFKIKAVQNVIAIPETYSFGDNLELINTKYVKANKVFFDSKWEVSRSPETSFKYVDILDAYVKLKPGMETPNFYDQ